MTRDQILDSIRRQGGLPDQETALRVARAVVCGLRDRLSLEEGAGLEHALRGDLSDLLVCQVHAHKPPTRRRDRLTEPELVERVQEEAILPDRSAARRLVRVVLETLSSRFGEEDEATATNVAKAVGSLADRTRGRGGSGSDEE